MDSQFLMSRGRRFGFAFVATVVIGAVGPWVDLGTTTRSGLDVDDGAVTLTLAGITFLYLLFRRVPHWLPVAVFGALIALIGVIDIIDISDVGGGLLGAASPGWGIWLTAIGGVGLVVSAVAVMRPEAGAPFGLVEKVIVGILALLLVLGVIGSLTQEEAVNEIQAPQELTVPE